MGHFAKIKKEENEDMRVSGYDPKNPFSRLMEDEGTWIEINQQAPEKEIKEDEEEVKNGSTNT